MVQNSQLIHVVLKDKTSTNYQWFYLKGDLHVESQLCGGEFRDLRCMSYNLNLLQ